MSRKFRIGDRVKYKTLIGEVVGYSPLAPDHYEVEIATTKPSMWVLAEDEISFVPQATDLIAGIAELLNEIEPMSPRFYSGQFAASCDHSWKNYVGLTETFYYCDHCDEHRSIHDDNIAVDI